MSRLTRFVRETLGGAEKRSAGEWGMEHIIPSPWSGFVSDAGIAVTESDAYGIPAVSNVIRSAAGIIASLPFFVYTDTEVRQEARDSWQWSLLHDQPSEYCDAFRFWYDLALSLEATQNAFVLKVKGLGSRRGRLEELHVLDPHGVTVKWDKEAGEKRFVIYGTEGADELTPADVLHIRGFTPNPGGLAGVSLITTHRNTLGSQRAMQQYEGDYFKRKGIPPFWFTGAANPQQAKQIVDAYKMNRSNALQGDPGGLWGVIDVKSIPLSMADAAYIDNKKLSLEDVCAIWDWPLWMIRDAGERLTDPNARMSEFMRTKLLPRLVRIQSAFLADADIFANSRLFGEFKTAAMERGDVHTRYDAYRLARQGGWTTANELRALENLPPHAQGDELQETPVGGAPNTQPRNANAD